MYCAEKCLYFNGTIVTMDDDDNHFEAVLTCGDRIEAVGTADELTRLAGPNLRKIDLDGGILYPGFIDTHSHIEMYAGWVRHAYVGGTDTLAEAMSVLQAHAAARPDEPVVMGYGYDDTATRDGRGPTAPELDQLFGERPTVVVHISIHAAYVNTAMLRLLGVDPDKPSDNVEIVCADGRPTGLLTENMALQALAMLPAVEIQDLKEGLLLAMKKYNEQGITSTIGGGLGLGGISCAMTLQAIGELEREGKMSVRCHMPVFSKYYREAKASGLLDGAGSPWLRVHGIKLLTDGSIQACTAAVKDGYHLQPDLRPDCILSQEEADELVLEAHAAGQRVIAHGNGDGAIERIILAVERAQERCPRANPHHLLIHCQMASDSQLERMKAAGLEPSFFVLHVWNWADRHKAIFLGPERTSRIDPCGSAARLGLPLSLHADTPVLPQMTMRSIHTAVNRTSRNGELFGPDQRISALEAMRAYTTHAAVMALDWANRGSIEPGKLADFTLLDKDPRSVPPETIKDVTILSVVSGGRRVWGTLSS